MTLGELQAWVLRSLKRPDLSVQALDAINASIEYASAFGDFSFDLVEGTQAIDAQTYAQSFVVATVFPRFRKIKYLRPVGYNRYLKWRDPSRIFDEKGCEVTNVYYRAGTNIVFKLQALASSMLYGYYAYPTRFTSADSSLSNDYTDQMSSVLHDLASSRMWADNGNDAESKRLEVRGLHALSVHKSDKADGTSYS